MRPLAQAFADAGFSTELPLLPGHGTAVEDMAATDWADWHGAAEAAYLDLASRCRRVVVAGLSMGGTLACRLAADHPNIAGVVAINAAVEPPADSFLDMLKGVLDSGSETMPGVGSDIARPDMTEAAYELAPVRPMISLFEAVRSLHADLGRIACPVLIFTSTQDHVVPPTASEVLAGAVSGPVERVVLERSYHVATLDYDAPTIEAGAVEFARRVTKD
jgi:carboxylesterase